jgi:DNA helicase MCM8
MPLTTDRVMVRMSNYSPITALKNLKANFVDRFVALRGNVVRISNVRPLVTAMSFQCTKCGHKIDQLFIGTFSP